MNTKKRIFGINALISVIVVLFILIIINITSNKYFMRADLTERKLYSLSRASIKLASNLKDIINVEVYFTKDLPPALIGLKTQVEDLLKEYQTYSRNRLLYKFVDPGEDKELQRKLRALGIPAVQMNVRTKDKFELKTGYLGLVILYQGKKETIPVIESISNFEYEFTAALKKLTIESTPKVGYLAGYSKKKFDEDYSNIQFKINKEYELRRIEITDKRKKIPDDITTLLVIGQNNIPDTVEYSIDQFLMHGGNAIFLLDSVKVNLRNFRTEPVNSGINDMLHHYGAEIENKVALDIQCITAGFRTQQYQFITSYPYWIKVTNRYMNKNNPIVGRLDAFVLQWTSPVKIVKQSDTDVTITQLCSTSERGWTRSYPFNLDPRQRIRPPGTGTDKQTLAVLISGKLNSFYTDKKNPWLTETEDTVTKDIKAVSEKIDKSAGSSIFIVGNSEFINDMTLSRYKSNSAFFLNALEYLTSGSDLIGIRSRSVTDRPFDEINDSKRDWLKFINIGLVPLIVIIIALLRSFFKYRSRKKYLTFY